MTSQAALRKARQIAIPELELVRMPLWKRAVDVAGAAVGVVLLLPFFAVIALAIVLESPGGPLYRHLRVGRGGREFVCWKFRSMRVDADEQLDTLREHNEANGQMFKIRNDPRKTRVGAFLRRTGLDEAPQLWNVLRGQMSLVGPRPPLPREVTEYEPHHFRRLAGVPGITGLWQVSARRNYDFEEMVRMDVEYLRRIAPWRDAVLILRTVPALLLGRGS